MNVKFKALVASVALVASATANAAVKVDNATAELFFNAWDATTGKGYTFDLDWTKTLNDFIGADLGFTATNNATLDGRKLSLAMIGDDGVIYDSALTGLVGAGMDLSKAEWYLAAADNTGRRRLLITEGNAGSDFAQSTNNNGISGITTNIQTFVGLNKGLGTPEGAASNDVDEAVYSALENGGAYAGNVGATFAGKIADTTTTFGDSSYMYYFAGDNSNPASSSKSIIQNQFFAEDGRVIVASTYLSDSGEWRLRIAAVDEIPEPQTYGMMLAGLALMGAVARRRS